MATLTTKYSIGDVVYYGGTTTIRKQRPCPDCLGTKKWKAASPAGVEYEFPCPRCAASYNSNDDITLNYSAHVPSIKKMTIGQVRVQEGGENEIRYMCLETGIGSGTLWNEADLFETEERAREYAEVMAKLRDQETGWVAKQYDKTLSICDYELSNAVTKAARDLRTSLEVRYSMLKDDLRDCQTNAEILDAFERYEGRVRELAA